MKAVKIATAKIRTNFFIVFLFGDYKLWNFITLDACHSGIGRVNGGKTLAGAAVAFEFNRVGVIGKPVQPFAAFTLLSAGTEEQRTECKGQKQGINNNLFHIRKVGLQR